MNNNPVSVPAASSRRLLSLDALRGFDMFWIVGAEWLVHALREMAENPVTDFLGTQMSHARWAGMNFLNLIFPLFVFIVGISTVFSLTKALETGGRRQALKRIIIRCLLIYLVGLFYSGGISHSFANIRWLGVLQRIALCYLCGALLFCYCKPRTLAVITAGLLVGYWALLAFVPIRNYQFVQPDDALDEMASQSNAVIHAAAKLSGSAAPAKTFTFSDAARKRKRLQLTELADQQYAATTAQVTGQYAEGLNLANHLDYRFLPGRRYNTFWDPEGLLSTLPAIATCLLGIFTGLLLRRRDCDDQRKVLILCIGGAAAVALGLLWGVQFPIIKRIWTSSYVLLAGGYSALLMAAFYWLIEVRQWRRWCAPLVWIGANPITIYLAVTLLDFRQIATRILGGDISQWLNQHLAQGAGDLAVALLACAFVFLFVRFLYQRKIFLRL